MDNDDTQRMYAIAEAKEFLKNINALIEKLEKRNMKKITQNENQLNLRLLKELRGSQKIFTKFIAERSKQD